MKTQLKLIPLFVIVAVACSGLYLSAFVRAQDSQATPDPNANKKEGTYGATNPSPTPTATPRR
jgi:hypothetical protein